MKATDPAWWRPFRVVDGIGVVHVDLRPDPDREETAAAWLDRAENDRLHRFRIERPRRDFALCRAALRANLCDLLECTNDRLSFEYREHGKPFALVDGQPASLGFNVSHSAPHGLIAFAPARSPRRRIGVDAEVRRPDRDFDGIAERVYGSRERTALAAAWGEDKVRLFYRLWTLKEAIIKALGTGFTFNPSRFEVPPAMIDGADSGTLRIAREPDRTWRLACLSDAGFAAALAYELDAGGH
ncbi:MAG: 4'-phosphopantetheinyl transferase superfamily protein [Gammaproteobacteria bacterium]|nr:4'-phosphopantetheinyl transferase superfamily protein [Gammaproteobacteria bacterium]